MDIGSTAWAIRPAPAPRRAVRRRVGALVLASLLSGCGLLDDDDPAPTAVGGSGEVAPAPPPAPPPGPPPQEPPAPPTVRSLPAETLVRALRSHRRPGPGYPEENLLALRPVSPAEGAGGIGGTFYASSSLIHGGEGVVSRLQSLMSVEPFVSLEYFASSGTDSWYVANVELTVAQGGALRFDGILSLSRAAPVPFDRPLHGWRLETPDGPASVTLSLESVDGEPEAFAVCWRMRSPPPIPVDRTMCTVHAGAIAARVVVVDASGARLLADTGPVPSPWNASPPEGTPAPSPDPRPIRTIRGDTLSAALRRPAYAMRDASGNPLADPLAGDPTDPSWSVRMLLDAPDAPGSFAGLTASLARSALGNPYGSWDLRIDTAVDGARAATVDARIDVFRYGGQLGPVALTAEGGTLAVAQPEHLGLGSGDYLPLDRTVGAWRDARLGLQLVLQSTDDEGATQGPGRGYRVCWRALSATIDRLACGVHEVEGETVRIVDRFEGRTATYRR